MKRIASTLFAFAFLLTLHIARAESVTAPNYRFDGSMPEEVLRSYLARSMTLMYLLTGHGNLEDNIRMMKNCGVKFAGRAVYQWGREDGGESSLPRKLELAKANAAKVHAVDPDIILQGCIFEIVSRDVEKVAVPAWVFEELGRPVEQRNFRYDDIIYTGGRGNNQWGRESSVPDVSRPETKLWFHYLAGSYLDIGCEAIHFGQAQLMDKNDPSLEHWSEVLANARKHAAKNARRHFVMCDAHVPGGGLVRDGKLLFDFHSFPLRIEELPEKPKQAQLRVGYTDAIYGRSKGGVTPGGWSCEHLPFLAEFDNYGRSRNPGEAGMGRFWVWGWDEITWFSQQPENERNEWLRYAWKWVRENDRNGYVQMPGARCLSGAANGQRWYRVNNRSDATPDGFGQEEAIRAIWMADDAARGTDGKSSTPSADVRQVEWAKFRAAPSEDLQQSRKILLNAVRYNAPWLAKTYPPTEDGLSCVVNLPEKRRHEHTIRPACSPVFSLAVALRTGEWDEKTTGISRDECLKLVRRTVRGISALHVANTEGKAGWGDHWQSALWSAMLSHGAWMLWDELDETTRGFVAKMVVHEAGRFIAPDYKPLVWATREKVITPGNTRAEENAWDSMILHVAVAMMPRHPDARRWREAASMLMTNAFAMRADLDDATTKIDGRPVKDWLHGYNVRDDGAIINHNLAHPDYAACVFLSSRVFMTQSLVGEKVPESADFNSAKVYRMLAEKRWESPPHKPPGGTILVPGKAEVYFPDGTDWSPYRFTEYYLLDTVAHYLGWDRGLPHSAHDWLRLRGAKCLEMQARHENGKFYKPGEFDTYPGAEQSVLGCAGDACLMHWLAACGALQPKANWLAN